MFERFTERARKVIVQGQNEAARLRHDHIGTEHLLLGLLREEEGVAAQALHAVGVTLGGAREQVETIVGYGEEHSGQAPFTARSKRSLEHAVQEALDLGHNYIGTEHLLLGLIRDEDGAGPRALRALGVHLDEVREQVESLVGYGEEETGAQAPLTPRSKKVLQLAEREATQLDDALVGSEHVLLGLVRESEGVAARVLSSLGVDPDAVRREVIRRLPASRIEPDSLDEVEREMEEEERDRRLFRGRVAGIRAELDLPRRLPVTVDADYAYRATLGFAGVEPGDVAEVVHDELSEVEARSLETVVTMLGERLLTTLHEVLEVTVTISGRSDAVESPTFCVSATFRR